MRGTLTASLVVSLLLAACNGAPSDREPELGMVWHACADEVEIALPTEHRCGTLTVPVDHDDRRAGVLGLGVVQVSPRGGAPGPDVEEVALSVGFDFGTPRQAPGDLHLLAERIGVSVVALMPRGVGQEGGTPLHCHELDGVGTDTLDQPDRVTAARFLDSVTSCHARLTSRGVDLDLYGTDDVARDVESLRSALDLDRWYAMISYGSLSRVTDAYAVAHPDRVRAVVQDSPAPHGRDAAAHADGGLRSALHALFAECKDDPRCARRYPHLEHDWNRALRAVAAHPLTATADIGPVTMDQSRFVRGVRAILGQGPGAIEDLPRVISLAAEGELHPTLSSQATDDPDLCLGHRPSCTQPEFSMGAYLSQACPESRAHPTTAEPQHNSSILVQKPYPEACNVWDVAPVEPAEAPNVPTLVITGHLDAWSRPEWFDDPLVVRGARHDVAGSATCVFDVRNPWIADPSAGPDHGPCDVEPFPDWD